MHNHTPQYVYRRDIGHFCTRDLSSRTEKGPTGGVTAATEVQSQCQINSRQSEVSIILKWPSTGQNISLGSKSRMES